MIGKQVKNILEKCDICLEGEIISRELLIQTFCKYLCDSSERDIHNTGIILHTGALCFDAICIVWSALTAIVDSNTKNEEILRSIQLGSMVLYNRKRYVFRGIQEKSMDGQMKEMAVLDCGNGNTTSVGAKGWSAIIPYQGDSARLDGRGIRSGGGIREKFYVDILGYEAKDVPGITETSVVAVMEKSRADLLMAGLSIRFGMHDIRLAELVTASYFTDEKEYPYGGNPGKNEAVLKFTSKISVAHDMLYEKNGNRHLGVIVCGNESVSRGETELPSLLSHRSLKYVFVSAGMDMENADSLVDKNPEAAVFACTKDFLLSNSLPPMAKNRYTEELFKQVDSVIEKELITETLPCAVSWEEYLNFKQVLGRIKREYLTEEEKDSIIIPSCSLMKLFMTAPFPIKSMEELIEKGKLLISSPEERMENLRLSLKILPENLQEAALIVPDVIETLYLTAYDGNSKADYLYDFIQKNKEKNVAVVVPKAYYADILRANGVERLMSGKGNLTIVTANRFDREIMYDTILTVGDFTGKRFDAFNCQSSCKIAVLLYEPEEKTFAAKKKKAFGRGKTLNRRSFLPVEDGLSDETETENAEYEVVRQIDNELEQFVNQSVVYNLDFAVEWGKMDGSSVTDVSAVALFESGEGGYFSRQYRAYVFDEEKEEIMEKKTEELMPGDQVIFTRRTDETKDIVDYVLQKLLLSGHMPEETVRDYEMSGRWKRVLSDYMQQTGYTPKEIAEQMIRNGVGVQEATVKNWLDEDSRSVGPQKRDSIEQIALLTGDDEMFDNADKYFVACRNIRSVRRNILKEIGKLMLNRFVGENTFGGIIPPEMYEQIDSLAQVLRIETIVAVNREVPAYLVNRPINSEGGL